MYSINPLLAQERRVFGCVPKSFEVFEALNQEFVNLLKTLLEFVNISKSLVLTLHLNLNFIRCRVDK